MIYRHTDEDIQRYRDDGAMNQTGLKMILKGGIQNFLAHKDKLLTQDDLYYEEKTHFVIGSAVDCIITQGDDVFENKFHVSRLARKPGEKAMSIIKMAFDQARVNFPSGIDIKMELYREEIFNACDAHEYYMARRNKEGDFNLDTRVAGLLKENGQAYWEDLYLAEGKQVLSDNEASVVQTIVNSFRTHPHTKYLLEDDEDTDLVFQLPIYWIDIDTEVPCKGLIDQVIISHKLKTISPIDAKTMGDYVLNFGKAVKVRRYDIQGSFYSKGLGIINNIATLSKILGRDLSGYKISNFAFMVESTIYPGTPLIYVLNDDAMRQGERGDGKEILGWKQALAIYDQWASVEFSIEEKFKESNGVVFLDDNFEYV